MSENVRKILRKYNIPSSLTDSGIGLQEDEDDDFQSDWQTSAGPSARCGSVSLSSRTESSARCWRRAGKYAPGQLIQDGISYETEEGTLESPSGVERSKLESRSFKRPPPARAQKKRAKGEPPTIDNEAPLAEIAAYQTCPTKSSTSSSTTATSSSDSELGPRSSPSCTSFKDTGTLTELNNNSCAEIELVSLIEEHIPRYKLRADTITDFTGYDNADWVISAPLLPPGEPIDLAPEVIEQTLNYFILCADRLTQMTRTYDDNDALIRLLEEKERDLELAAHIGKSLLDEKRTLQEKIDLLEHELESAHEAVTQLRHDLSKKNSLLSICMEVEEEGLLGEESPASLDLLQRKINELENENERLKVESQSWTEDLCLEEERETELINECLRELQDKNKAAATLQEELAKKTENVFKQQEEITHLLSQQVDLQKKLREYSIENETLRVDLDVMSETQQELTHEISEARDKYNTLLSAFQELQEALRQRTRNGSVCSSIGVGGYAAVLGGASLAGAASQGQSLQNQSGVLHSKTTCSSQAGNGPYPKTTNFDSLATELCMSMGTECSEGYHSDDRAPTASMSNCSPRPSSRRPTPRSLTTNGRRPASGEFDCLSDEGESSFPESSHTDDDSQYSSLSSIGLNPVCGKHPLGLDFNASMKGLLGPSRSFYDLDEDRTSRCRTPDSILSGFNGFSGGSSTSSTRRYRLPDKLQIIKRLEGSQALDRWRTLATPTPLSLIGREETTDGVKTRAVPKSPPSVPKNELPKPPCSLDITTFLQEIDNAERSQLNLPGKSFVESSCIYTYSNSNILHPDATNIITSSVGPPKMATSAGFKRSPVQTTPSVINRSSYLATTTCSVNKGLARMLNERGIHAMLPSVLREKSEGDEDKSATSTPAPSPDQSCPGTPSNEPVDDELDALLPDLVRENRAKGVVLRTFRLDGRSSSPVRGAAAAAAAAAAGGARGTPLRKSKRGSQELDAQGLVSKLSRLVQWPFQGFVSDGNSVSTSGTESKFQTSSVTTTSTMTDTITSVIPIMSSVSIPSSGTSGSTTSCLTSSSVSSVMSICSGSPCSTAGPPLLSAVVAKGFATGNSGTLSSALRMPLARAPNPLLQINAGRRRPFGTVSSMRTMRKGALM